MINKNVSDNIKRLVWDLSALSSSPLVSIFLSEDNLATAWALLGPNILKTLPTHWSYFILYDLEHNLIVHLTIQTIGMIKNTKMQIEEGNKYKTNKGTSLYRI